MKELFSLSLETIRKKGFIYFLRKVIVYVSRSLLENFKNFLLNYFGILFRRRFLNKFRRLIDSSIDIEGIVDLVLSFSQFGISIKPSQVREEIIKLLKLINRINPKVIVEIGTFRGGTLFLFTRVADPKATIISVDLPGGRFGGGYPRWKIPLYRSFTRDEQKLYLIRGDSHNINTYKEVKRILGDRKIDFLFIDGDHRYEGVKRDFNIYSHLVKEGGVIAFHDIVSHDRIYNPSGTVGVPKFWSEIKNNCKHLEIVKSWEQGWGGIGVLYL